MLKQHLDSIFSGPPQEETLQTLISSARIRKGLSKVNVADMLGIHKTAWGRFENGADHRLSNETILKSCDILDLDPYRVFFLIGRVHPDLEARLLADWDLYNGVREAIGL